MSTRKVDSSNFLCEVEVCYRKFQIENTTPSNKTLVTHACRKSPYLFLTSHLSFVLTLLKACVHENAQHHKKNLSQYILAQKKNLKLKPNYLKYYLNTTTAKLDLNEYTKV